MNRQKNAKSRGIEWTDYTWNPVAGCLHACQWTMPDGTIANCYAEDVASRVARLAYPEGFEHHYWHPAKLGAPLKLRTPARIFVGSMADLFGHWVPAEHIEQVLDVCRRAHWHTFQLLTKNPIRAKEFAISANCWVGASTPPDFMWNQPLKPHQQEAMLNRTLTALAAVNVPVRWLSIEPLSRDYSEIIAAHPGVLRWAVIGAASAGPRQFPPAERDFIETLRVLDEQGMSVFFKGNLLSLPAAAAAWREDFPIVSPAPEQSVAVVN